MNKRIFEYENTDGNDIKLEIDMDLLTVKEFATTYNFKGEIISRNKCTDSWRARSQLKLFKILKNTIGNMPSDIREKYLKFVNELEGDYK